MHIDIIIIVVCMGMVCYDRRGICMLCDDYSVCCAEGCGDVTTEAQELCGTP